MTCCVLGGAGLGDWASVLSAVLQRGVGATRISTGGEGPSEPSRAAVPAEEAFNRGVHDQRQPRG